MWQTQTITMLFVIYMNDYILSIVHTRQALLASRPAMLSSMLASNAVQHAGQHAVQHAGQHCWPALSAAARNMFEKTWAVNQFNIFMQVLNLMQMKMMDSVDDMDVSATVVVSSSFLLMAAVEELRRHKRKKRTVWVKPWMLTRPVRGAYGTLVSDLMSADAVSFKNYTRMDLPAFEDLLFRVEGVICKQWTRFRPTISPR